VNGGGEGSRGELEGETPPLPEPAVMVDCGRAQFYLVLSRLNILLGSHRGSMQVSMCEHCL
jgi:hypothetical protein